MQGTAWFASAAGFALAMSATPGPNNALVAATAANFGLRRSLPQVLGVSVGVMALLIALALMTGLQAELRDRIVGSTAHVFVYKIGGFEDVEADIKKLLTVPRVLGAAGAPPAPPSVPGF